MVCLRTVQVPDAVSTSRTRTPATSPRRAAVHAAKSTTLAPAGESVRGAGRRAHRRARPATASPDHEGMPARATLTPEPISSSGALVQTSQPFTDPSTAHGDEFADAAASITANRPNQPESPL